MRIKAGAELSGVHFALWYAAAVYDYLRTINGLGEGTLTGGREGVDPLAALQRVQNTMHPAGFALDFRANDIPAAVRPDFGSALRRALGGDFDVIMHGSGASIHYHVELARKVISAGVT